MCLLIVCLLVVSLIMLQAAPNVIKTVSNKVSNEDAMV
ncbi:hypothetical protein GPUN_0955 [Glaciecola punicea ACAM 611]|uniref:Uncharacterized protein n=1 Tax=Glaciecola punicea ACAM 611 TaxID=1121923 RepID=H5T9V9_9ALTE|nr:hypothetical protein GPUN_0955 [Glaciecola punicea ACAM 611]